MQKLLDLLSESYSVACLNVFNGMKNETTIKTYSQNEYTMTANRNKETQSHGFSCKSLW